MRFYTFRSQRQGVQRQVVSGAGQRAVQRLGRRHRQDLGLRAAGVRAHAHGAQGPRAGPRVEPRLPAHHHLGLVGLHRARVGRAQRKVPRRRKRTRRRRLRYKFV